MFIIAEQKLSIICSISYWYLVLHSTGYIAEMKKSLKKFNARKKLGWRYNCWSNAIYIQLDTCLYFIYLCVLMLCNYYSNFFVEWMCNWWMQVWGCQPLCTKCLCQCSGCLLQWRCTRTQMGTWCHGFLMARWCISHRLPTPVLPTNRPTCVTIMHVLTHSWYLFWVTECSRNM